METNTLSAGHKNFYISLNYYKVIGFLLLATLSITTMPFFIKAQVIYLTSALGLLIAPFFIWKIKWTPLFQMTFLLILFVFLHSLIALLVEVNIGENIGIRLFAWLRQLLTFTSGVCVFFVLRKALIKLSDKFIIRSIVIGSLPALILGGLSILGAIEKMEGLERALVSIRKLIAPFGYQGVERASGLSLEPAHFAFYLAIVVIPICLIGLIKSKYSLIWLFFLGVTLLIFIWTFSSTGFLTLLALFFGGIFFGPKRKIFVSFLIIGSFLALIAFIVFPHNYFIRIFKILTSGGQTVTFSSRAFSVLGILLNPFSYNFVGYGLGGTSTYLSEAIPPEFQTDILKVTWEDMPRLNSFIAQFFVENGFIGLSLFVLTIFFAIKEAKYSQIKLAEEKVTDYFLKIFPAVLLAFIVGAIVGSFSSYMCPYLWFWLALIDSRYLKEFLQNHAKKLS